MATTLSLGLREALTMLRAGLEAIYGDRLAGLRLYGSQARGDARTDSDVDLAVLFEGPIVNGAEIERTSLLRQRINLETGLVASCIYLTPQELERGSAGIYRKIRREGVAV